MATEDPGDVWLGTTALLGVQAHILSFVPWEDLCRNVPLTCRVFYSLATEWQSIWALKHREHFGWASKLLSHSASPWRSKADFAQLYKVQQDALKGNCIDIEGQWIGHGNQEGFIYHLRLTVHSGPEGEKLWRYDGKTRTVL